MIWHLANAYVLGETLHFWMCCFSLSFLDFSLCGSILGSYYLANACTFGQKLHFYSFFQGKIMERKISRKLSSDMQRKLSAISNCSDVSNLSVVLGMDPNDFKSTIQNILGNLHEYLCTYYTYLESLYDWNFIF